MINVGDVSHVHRASDLIKPASTIGQAFNLALPCAKANHT